MMVSYIEENEKSSLTKDLQQQQIISSSLKGNRGQYDLTSPPPSEHISYKPDMVGTQYGWVKIISPERRWNQAMNQCYVLTECQGCGSIQWQNLYNLKSGRSRGCQNCTQRRPIPYWLDRRLTAAKQRCENPNDPGYSNYGARGIKFEFPSVIKAGLYLIQNFGIPSRVLEIDRIDNNGNYAPGNIRFVTRKENCANRRITVLSQYNPEHWPYSEVVVRRKLSEGLSRGEIIQDAKTAVFEKRKNWRGIQERLKSMTYSMPEDIIVLPYRGS